MRKMRKVAATAIFIIFLVFALGSVRSVFADVPEIRNVVVYQDGADIKLNVTVYHFEEVSDDYVDLLQVIVTTGTPHVNQTFPQSGPHVLDPVTHTFNVTLDIGPINGSPLCQVEAHCITHGWSTINWTGTVPEYSFPLLLAVSMISLIVLFKSKSRRSLSVKT
jgi:hypothetical protein